MRHRLLLFVVSCVLGGLGGVLGSIVGNAAGKTGLFVGGIAGGLLAASSSGLVARWRGWIPPHRALRTGVCAAIGFLAAALIATRCLQERPDDPLQAARRLDTTTFFGAFSLDPITGLQRGHRLSVIQWRGTKPQPLAVEP